LEQTWAKRNHNPYLNVFHCRGPSTYRKKPRTKKSKGQRVSTEEEDDPDTIATQLYESGVLGDAKDLDEAKNRLDRFRVEEKPLFLLGLLIARYAPGDDDIVIDPCFGTGSTGVAAFLENKSFYGMDEDLLATVVADRYLKQTSKKAKAKAAGKVFGDPEAVEAGVKRTPGLSSSDDDEEEEGTLDEEECTLDEEEGTLDESDNDAVVTPQANDRWYLGDSTNDDGKHVLTLFYQKKDKSWDFENKPVVFSLVEMNESTDEFILSLSLVSNLNARFTLRSGNWDPQTEKEFSNDNPLACMVSEKLKTLHDGPVVIDVFTTELLLIIDDFNKVVSSPIDTPIH
jgi:hypothetical protein